jgi:hypothetical protein
MSWLAKTRLSNSAAPVTPSNSKPGSRGSSAAVELSANMRTSNGLKEFLWLTSDISRARILDLGPISQSTVDFFVDKGRRVSSEDMLRTWTGFLAEEQDRLRLAANDDEDRPTPQMTAAKFLSGAIQYPPESVHGILAWDLLDYFEPQVVTLLIKRLYESLHPGGVMLTLFHSRHVETFHRYRVVNANTVELLLSPVLTSHAHVFQNREILDLFSDFRSSKTFVGRDQVREVLFLK